MIEKGAMTDAEYIAALIAENQRLHTENKKLSTDNKKFSTKNIAEIAIATCNISQKFYKSRV